MEVLSQEIVYAAHSAAPKNIAFSPLDLFAGGHMPLGPLLGFRNAIDSDRFRFSLKIALDQNPEMGVAVRIADDGTHTMQTGHGIELILQRCDEPLFAPEAIPDLPLDRYPLAYPPLTSFDVVDRQLPLLGFRITNFSDGGCILGVRTTHSHGDGTALFQFLQMLSAIYRGNSVLSPMSDRSAIAKLATGDGAMPSAALPIAPVQRNSEFCFAATETAPYKTIRTILSSAAFARIVKKIKRYDATLSSADILNALIWKAWSRATTASDVEMTHLYNIFNIRQLDDLRIPRDYQGNAVLDRAVMLSFGEVRNAPIIALARARREQIKPLKTQDILQDIAYLTRLQCEKFYGKDGALNGFQRNLYRDLIAQRGLFINDMRFIHFDRVRFGDRALWFEQGQGHAQGVVSIFQQEEDILVRYGGLVNETKIFVAALQEAFTEDFRIA